MERPSGERSGSAGIMRSTMRSARRSISEGSSAVSATGISCSHQLFGESNPYHHSMLARRGKENLSPQYTDKDKNTPFPFGEGGQGVRSVLVELRQLRRAGQRCGG